MDKKKAVKELRGFRARIEKDIHIDKIVLFGSMATGKMHRWSDIDLVIVSRNFQKMNFFERGAKMYDYWNIKRPVDFLCFTPQEFNRMKERITIVKQALEEGVEI